MGCRRNPRILREQRLLLPPALLALLEQQARHRLHRAVVHSVAATPSVAQSRLQHPQLRQQEHSGLHRLHRPRSTSVAQRTRRKMLAVSKVCSSLGDAVIDRTSNKHSGILILLQPRRHQTRRQEGWCNWWVPHLNIICSLARQATAPAFGASKEGDKKTETSEFVIIMLLHKTC